MSLRRRRFPYVSAGLFAIALAPFGASLGEFALFHTAGAGIDGGWWVAVRHGRVIASQSNLLSSYISLPAEPSLHNLGGFSYKCRRFGPGPGAANGKVMSRHVAVPTYPLPLTAGLLLGWRIRRWRRGRTPGTCPKCGYDLRASPARCPECGTIVTGGVVPASADSNRLPTL